GAAGDGSCRRRCRGRGEGRWAKVNGQRSMGKGRRAVSPGDCVSVKQRTAGGEPGGHASSPGGDLVWDGAGVWPPLPLRGEGRGEGRSTTSTPGTAAPHPRPLSRKEGGEQSGSALRRLPPGGSCLFAICPLPFELCPSTCRPGRGRPATGLFLKYRNNEHY